MLLSYRVTLSDQHTLNGRTKLKSNVCKPLKTVLVRESKYTKTKGMFFVGFEIHHITPLFHFV